MKKLCLTFVFSLLLAPLFPSAVDAASSSKKKHAKKKTQAKTTQTAAQAPVSQAAPNPLNVASNTERNHGFSRAKLVEIYNYGKNLYAAKRFSDAKEVFKKLVLASTDSDLNSDSLYLYSQCAFRTEDYTGCVKALTVLAKRWPNCPIIKTGYVSRFCYFLINQVTALDTNWDYYRFEASAGGKDGPVWKESIPPGYKMRRINFRLGFGLYRVVKIIEPNSPQTADAGKRLNYMLNAPITMVWVDEKAPPNPFGHAGDFYSIFSENEKKYFSKIICDRMFFDWESERLYKFLDMYDDVRNQRPRFVARTKPPEDAASASVTNNGAPLPPGAPSATTPQLNDPLAVLTLYKLFDISGYNPYEDSYTNVIENSPTDLNL